MLEPSTALNAVRIPLFLHAPLRTFLIDEQFVAAFLSQVPISQAAIVNVAWHAQETHRSPVEDPTC